MIDCDDFWQYLSDLTQMNHHSAAAAYTSMAQPFGVAAHTPPHMPTTVRQDSMGTPNSHFTIYIQPYHILH